MPFNVYYLIPRSPPPSFDRGRRWRDAPASIFPGIVCGCISRCYTEERGHTAGSFLHLPSEVLAFCLIARRIGCLFPSSTFLDTRYLSQHYSSSSGVLPASATGLYTAGVYFHFFAKARVFPRGRVTAKERLYVLMYLPPASTSWLCW